MIEAIAPLHDKNPTTRTASNLVTFLQGDPKLNEREVYGIIMAGQQSETVSQDMHRKAMCALMRHAQRTGGVERFGRIWHRLLPVLGNMLADAFEDRRRLPASNWIRTHIGEISSFIEPTALRQCVDAMQKNAVPPEEALETALSTPVGSRLFACFRDKQALTDFVRSVRRGLDDLENLDYARADVSAFKTVMMRESQTLASVLGPYTLVQQPVPFLGVQLTLDVRGPACIWGKHLSARLKGIAIQTGLCPKLPWEDVLFDGEAGLQGVRETIQLDPSLVESLVNGRDAALAMMGQGATSLTEWKRCMNANRRELLECDEHFDLELGFLNGEVESLLSDRLRQQVLAGLPSEKIGSRLARRSRPWRSSLAAHCA